MAASDGKLLLVGRIGAAHGIKGEVRVSLIPPSVPAQGELVGGEEAAA